MRWLFLAFLFGAIPASAETDPLERARLAYAQLDYDECLKVLEAGQAVPAARERRAERALYQGLCAYGLNREAEAADWFAQARGLWAPIELPRHSSPKIRSLFESVAPAVIAPEPRSLTASAPPEVRSPGPWKWILSGVAVGAAAGGVGLGLAARQQEGLSRTSPFESESRSAGFAARGLATGANVAYAAALTTAIAAGVVFWMERAP